MNCLKKPVSLFLLLLAVLLAPVAAAQPTPTIKDELPTELRKDWEIANDAFRSNDFQAARTQYQKVYDLSKNPRVLYNLGVAWTKLNRSSQAMVVWQRALASRDKLPAKDIKKLEDGIKAVTPYVSQLQVIANEPGAVLKIEGYQVGTTPLIGTVPIDIGRQKVTLEKKDFVTGEQIVEVVRGTPVKVEFKLLPVVQTAPVSVSVAGAPNATIFINGKEMGPAPFKGEVEIGRRTFEARAAGFVTARQTSEVIYGEPLKLALTLTKSHDEGTIKILTNHDDAIIKVDGKVMGSGAWSGVLSAGGHQVEVSKQGYDSYTSDVAISPDQERTMRVALKLESGYAWVYWTVTGIAVVAGGTVAAYFVSRPTETSIVTGTLDNAETGFAAPGPRGLSFSF
jgi:hypothetical protein